jgi:hypothetical protein
MRTATRTLIIIVTRRVIRIVIMMMAIGEAGCKLDSQEDPEYFDD